MRLLHVTASMDPRSGGPCEGIRNLAANVSAQGHEVEAVCLDDADSDYLSNEKLKIHALGRGRGRWAYHDALLPWLNANLHQYNAVIQNGIWQFPGFALYRATRQSSVTPCFIFPHGMLDPWFQRAPERRLKAVRNWIYWKLIQQRIIHNAAALLFTCAEEMRLARTAFRPYRPNREVVVGYGTNPPPEHREEMDAAFRQSCPELNGSTYFIFLGRIHPKKGVDLSIKAYAALHNGLPAASRSSLPRLVIAGPGLDTPYGSAMRELASETCPPGSVLWPGMLRGDAKWGALYGAQSFVLNSHQENFGIAVVEAMACGTPVLISNQVNIWREIEQTNAGLVAEDTLAGAEALFQRWVTFPPTEKDAMGKAARASFETHFAIARAASTLIETIQRPTERQPETFHKHALAC